MHVAVVMIPHIFNSVPMEFEQSNISDHTQREKWSTNELITISVREEVRVNRNKAKSTHLALRYESVLLDVPLKFFED